MSEATLVAMLAAKRLTKEKIRRAILKTVEHRTKEEQKRQEQRNQKLKQGFLNLLKDVIKKADELQENNKFLNRTQLKDETTRLINSVLNKKDKTQETVNSKLNSNLSVESTKSTESAKLIESTGGEATNLNSKISKWNLNTNLKENDKINSLNSLNKNKNLDKTNKANNEDENNNRKANDNLINELDNIDKSKQTEPETILDLHLQYLLLTDNLFSVDTGKAIFFNFSTKHIM